MSRLASFLSSGLVAFLLVGPAAAQQPSQPEAATGIEGKQLAHARRQMVAAANPLAAEAGRRILRAGGTAVDAAIATQMVLNLVEPQSSGIGGGAFIVIWNNGRKALSTIDAREKAIPRAGGRREEDDRKSGMHISATTRDRAKRGSPWPQPWATASEPAHADASARAAVDTC